MGGGKPVAVTVPDRRAGRLRLGDLRRTEIRPESDVVEQVEPLNQAEQDWVASNVAEATRMLEGKLSPERLDELWAALLEDDHADPNPAINTVGLGFGHLLAERLGLSGVALTDDNGTEIAVRRRANFTIFPTNFIAKRYAGRETYFISSAYDDFVRTAESMD